MPYPDRTQPENLVGTGAYRTEKIRGIGFAPTKQAVLVLPPEVENRQQLEAFAATQEALGLDCSTLLEQLESVE